MGGGSVALTDVLILCYHALSDEWEASLAVRPRDFERQLRLLVSRGYQGTTFERAVLDPPAARTLAVTFDDAYRSVIELALPVLSSLGVPATVFAPSAFIGSEEPMSWPGIDVWRQGPHERELIPMSWPELERLAEAGWEVGSHTRTHPRLTQLDDARLGEELERSRAEIEQRLSRPCPSLAYPYGDEDARVVEAAGRAGYSAAGALPSRLEDRGPLCHPRVGVYGADSIRRFRLKASPALRHLRRGPAWPLVGALSRVARRG